MGEIQYKLMIWLVNVQPYSVPGRVCACACNVLSMWCVFILSVPVVDLVDVPENDFVFSFHVVWDALLLNPLHEALKESQKGVEDALLTSPH